MRNGIRRFLRLRSWSWAANMLFRLLIFSGTLYLAYRCYHWIGPEVEPAFTGDDRSDLLEAQRAAFAELARLVKIGLLVLGVSMFMVLVAVYYSRHPVVFPRRSQTMRVPEKGAGKEAAQRSEREKSEKSSGDSEDGHNTIFIDPETLEDHRANERP